MKSLCICLFELSLQDAYCSHNKTKPQAGNEVKQRTRKITCCIQLCTAETGDSGDKLSTELNDTREESLQVTSLK